MTLLLATCSFARADVLDAFDPQASGEIGAVLALPDGRAILGGTFATVHGTAHANLARVRVDGSLDPSFVVDADGTVTALARQPDGKVLVGGFFTAIGGVERQHLARLNADGSLDMTFDPAVTGGNSQAVLGITLEDDGNVLIAGQFTHVGGLPHDGAARILANGAVDSTFNAAVGESVSVAIPLPDGRVVIGGLFTSVEGQGHFRLARLNANGTLDNSFNPFLDAGVSAIVRLDDGSLIVGGMFGVPRSFVARFDANGVADPDFDLHVSAGAGVTVLFRDASERLVVGGWFDTAGGATRHNLARFGSDFTIDPTLDVAFTNGGLHPVTSVSEAARGVLVVGGGFTMAGGEPRGHAARLRDDPVFGDGFD
jgi:uncharacterized delta-60 repeat protein